MANKDVDDARPQNRAAGYLRDLVKPTARATEPQLRVATRRREQVWPGTELVVAATLQWRPVLAERRLPEAIAQAKRKEHCPLRRQPV